MAKKGSLSLSVNAIVILILAIVMLGLGLGFVRGMFGKVSSQLEQQIAAEPEAAAPTGSSPITLSREMIVTHAGDKEVVKVGAYNPSSATWTSITPTLSCGATGDTINDINSQANAKTIEQGKSETFNLLVEVPSAAPDTYLCQMVIDTLIPLECEGSDCGTLEYQKDFTIKIIE